MRVNSAGMYTYPRSLWGLPSCDLSVVPPHFFQVRHIKTSGDMLSYTTPPSICANRRYFISFSLQLHQTRIERCQVQIKANCKSQSRYRPTLATIRRCSTHRSFLHPSIHPTLPFTLPRLRLRSIPSLQSDVRRQSCSLVSFSPWSQRPPSSSIPPPSY